MNEVKESNNIVLEEKTVVQATVLGRAISNTGPRDAEGRAVANASARFKNSLCDAYNIASLFDLDHFFSIEENVRSTKSVAIKTKYRELLTGASVGFEGRAVVEFTAEIIADLP